MVNINSSLSAFITTLMILCSVACAQQIKAEPANIPLETSFLSDPTAKLTINDVQSRYFTPYDSAALGRGYTSDVSWIRLRLQVDLAHKGPIVLKIQPHFLDHIDLYQKSATGWLKQSAGDKYNVKYQGNDAGSYRFLVNPLPNQDNIYYVKVKTSSVTFISIQAMSVEAANQAALQDQWIYGLQSGVLILLLLWGIFNYFSSKQVIFVFFSIFQATILLFNMAAWGTFSDPLFANFPKLDDLSFNFLYIARVLSTIWLGWAIMKNYATPKWFTYIAFTYLGIGIIECGMILNEYSQYALIANSALAIFSPIIQIVVTMHTKDIPRTISRFIITGYSIIIFILTYLFLSSLGVISTDGEPILLTRWIGHINGFIFFLIVWKINQLTHVDNQIKLTSLKVLQAESRLEKVQLKERETLIDMLVHELKNPLATIKIASGSLKLSMRAGQENAVDRLSSIDKSVDNMDSVIEHCILVDQLDRKEVHINKQLINIKELLEKLLASTDFNDRIHLKVDGCTSIKTDPFLLSIAINNLLNNANKYAKKFSTIELDIFLQNIDIGNFIVLTFKNEIGLHGHPNPDRIFERYYRNSLAQSQSGTGLGLYLTKSICNLLGAETFYNIAINKVIFTIRIPIESSLG